MIVVPLQILNLCTYKLPNGEKDDEAKNNLLCKPIKMSTHHMTFDIFTRKS